MSEDDLEFDEIRQMSPQWAVRHSQTKAVIALVTERYIAQPRFSVVRLVDGTEHFFETRDEVVDEIRSWMR